MDLLLLGKASGDEPAGRERGARERELVGMEDMLKPEKLERDLLFSLARDSLTNELISK